MSQPVKLLFDECLGKPLVNDLEKFLAWEDPKPQIRHLLDFFKAGTSDAVWIPNIADEGWMVLTADRARKSKDAKLPDICRHYQITHILMSASVLQLKQNQKANAIVAVWEQIKFCGEAPRGARFHLQLTPAKMPTIKPNPVK